MDDPTAKYKCLGYVAVLALVFAGALVSFRLTASADQLVFNVEDICRSLITDRCHQSPITDVEACLEAASDREVCSAEVMKWQRRINLTCEKDIYAYYSCTEALTCEDAKSALETCCQEVERPEWLPAPKVELPTWVGKQ